MAKEMNPDQKELEQQQIVDLGAEAIQSKKGNIYTITIIGQVEGHQVAPETVKTTKSTAIKKMWQ